MIESNNLPLVASVLFFGSFVLFFASLYNYFRHRRSRSRFINKIRLEGMSNDTASVIADLPGGDTAENPIRKLLGAVGDRVKPDDAKDIRIRTLDFIRAGIRRKNMLAVFWGVKCLLGLGFVMAFLSVKPVFFPLLKSSNLLVFSIILVSIGFYLPDLWLKIKISRRKRRIQEGLPDALDLLVICVEAGVSLDAAIHRVAEEIRLENKDLSEELLLMTMEVRAGKLRRDAMRDFAVRTDIDDIRSMVTLFIQTDKFGTSVAQALRVYSDSFRTTRMQRAEELAAKLPVKMLIPMALFIFPSIFVVLLGPAAIQIYHALIQK